MFSGIQEILVLVIIILLIFIAPRILTRQRPSSPAAPTVARFPIRVTGRLRLAVVATILWPLIIAAYLRPWHSAHLSAYLFLGLGPVLLGWAIAWVIAGFKKRRN